MRRSGAEKDLPSIAVAELIVNRVGQRVDVARWNEKAARPERLGQSPYSRRDRDASTGDGFESRQAERFVPPGRDQNELVAVQ